MEGATAQLAELIANTTYRDIPADVVERAKWGIGDYLAGAIAGSEHPDATLVIDHIDRCFSGSSTTILGNGTASLSGALLANGSFPLIIGAGDTFESVVIHPSPAVVPPLLAIAEAEPLDGRDLVTGYVIGMEAIFRIGLSTYPSHYKYWHGSGTIGVFGAVAGVSSALDLPQETIAHALGIAASFSSGLKKNLDQRVRPLHTGHAAQMGVQSALIAEQGLTANTEIFDGNIGYGEAMSDTFDPSPFTQTDRWAVLDTMLKPYPSGFITHAAMEGLRKLRSNEDIQNDEIETIEVEIDENIAKLFIHDPTGPQEGELSLQYCLALILLEDTPGPSEFTTEFFEERNWEEYGDLVEPIVTHNLFDNDRPVQHGARVTVRTTDGKQYTRTEEAAPGGPTNPIETSRLWKKFFEYTDGVLSQSDAEFVFDQVQHLDQVASPPEFIHRMR